MTGRYVALGSSMAAGPGIRPSAAGAPFGSGRSARNYAHLVCRATEPRPRRRHLLRRHYGPRARRRQRRARPQIEALDGLRRLVNHHHWRNDVGYVPLLMAASLPAVVRRLPPIAAGLRELFDSDARGREALDGIEAAVACRRRRGAAALAAGHG